MSQKLNAKAESGSSVPARNGGVFQDYSFRFSKLYTVLDKDKPSALQPKAKVVPQLGGKQRQSNTTAASKFNTLAPIPWKVQSGGRECHEATRSRELRASPKDRSLHGNGSAKVVEINLLRNQNLVQPEVLPMFVGSTNEKAKTAAAENAEVGAAPESCCLHSKRASADDSPQVAVSLYTCKPTTHLHHLPSPAFGEEVNVNVCGSNIFCESDALSKYSLASGASQGLRANGNVQSLHGNADSPAGERLYDLWRKRLAMRGLFRFRDELESYIYSDLENLTSSIISQEEYTWKLGELEKLGETVSNKTVFVNPKLLRLADGEATAPMDTVCNSGGRALGTHGLKTCRDDLPPSSGQFSNLVPTSKMKSFFVSLRAQLHERTVSLLQTFPMRLYTYTTQGDEKEGDVSDRGTDFVNLRKGTFDSTYGRGEKGLMTQGKLYHTEKEKEYINQLCQIEQNLTKDAVLNGAITPSVVSLPEERIIKPLMALETATSVALIWQVLRQCAASVPDVDFAMELFHSYLLPHIYDNFALYTSVLPSNGTLSEKVVRLSEIPLRSSMRLLSADATQQCRKDTQYMEAVLQHWALRSWRRCMMGFRRRFASLELVSKMLLRVRWRLRLQKIFGSWRFVSLQGKQKSYLNYVEKKYNSIMNSSCISTESVFLPSSSIQAPSTVSLSKGKRSIRNEGNTALTRSRFLARKLVENAQHVKETLSVATPSMEMATSISPNRVEPQMTEAQNQMGDQESTISSTNYQPTVESFLQKPVEKRKKLDEEKGANKFPPTAALDCNFSMSTSASSPLLSEVQPILSVNSSSERRTLAKDFTFDKILDILQEENEVCTHLRSEIAIQRKQIQMLERERNGLRKRNRTLEDDLVRTLEEKLYYCNLFQKKEFQLMDKEKLIIQLRSRLRAHRIRPWQRVTMRIAGELCGVSTQASETNDERRMRSEPRKIDEQRGSDGKEKTHDSHNEESDKKFSGDKFQDVEESPKEDDNSLFLSGEGGGSIVSTQATREAEEERLFGELAPIVLSSTTELPSAMIILQDWANSCLDDLESLDDLKGGALSLRFRSFSEEVRSGVLLSRLLFYLALPRYLQRNANSDERSTEAIHVEASAVMETKDGKDEKNKHIDTLYAEVFMRRRQQLLEQRNVQLDAPFPVYSECFGDLLNIPPADRMAMLLHFASQILNGSTTFMSDAVALKRQQVLNIVSATAGITLPPTVPTIELHEVVDPHALAMGERSSIITLLAILYVRFAHPFNHKSRQSAIVEKEAIFYLLNPRGYTSGSTTRHLQFSKSETEEKSAEEQDGRLQERQKPQHSTWIEDEILERLIDEDKSPWQLFKERCVPIFGSPAHPFLLRGNFWPCDAFESPQLANLLGELGMALNRSLQIHRWHILFSCLIPVINYSRVSRGVFTGPRASPVALRVGMAQEGVSLLPSLNSTKLEHVYAKRKARVMALCPPNADPNCPSPYSSDWKNTYVACEKRKLKEVLSVVTNDIMNLFLCNASLQPELALPVMDLSEWRTFCVDLGIVKIQRERGKSEGAGKCPPGVAGGVKPLELNFISDIFNKASHLHVYEDFNSFLSNKESDHNFPGTPHSASDFALSFDKFSDVLESGVLDDNKGKNFMQSCDLNVFGCASSTVVDDQRKRTEVGNKILSPKLHSALLSEYLLFPGFVNALIFLVDALYHPLPPEIASAKMTIDEGSAKHRGESEGNAPSSPPIVWLGDAITQFLNDYTLREDSIRFEKTPQAVLKRIQMGIPTQEVLTKYSSALLLVYQFYSKEIYGVICMQEENLLQLMRDAMLTSTETTQYMISEIFQKCSTLCKSVEEHAIALSRDLNGRTRDRVNNKIEFRIPSSRVGASSNPHLTTTDGSMVGGSTGSFPRNTGKSKRHEVRVLTLDGFTQFLCVLCHFKQPNPLIPLHQRLEIFLRRSVLRPLRKKIENLPMLLKRQSG